MWGPGLRGEGSQQGKVGILAKKPGWVWQKTDLWRRLGGSVWGVGSRLRGEIFNEGRNIGAFFFLKGVAPESGFHRNAKIARGMNPATPYPPLRVGAVQAEVLAD